ncbi:ROK family protein [Microbacterium sp. YY-01]|uniref:ROK family protein n=1 Tax=Microbacterium sp. YY-01 TaxID=3421634 RepID=UPI003D17D51A
MRVGLDVGGTKTDAVAVRDDGSIAARVRIPTGWGAEEVVDTIRTATAQLCEQSDSELTDIVSIGVGIPGLVDLTTGHVLHAVNLGIESLDLAGWVQHHIDVPCVVENDVKAAALGAAALRKDSRSMAFLNLGTGVAAGIVVDGELWRGMGGIAGEVGHISVDPQGRLCGCGQHGCVETLCGGGAVAKAWGRPGALPIRDIFDAAEQGDLLAAQLREGLAAGAAAAIRIIVLSADVETVVLGGGITALGARLLNDVKKALHRGAERSAFMKSLKLDERIELLPSGSPAAALGAALVGVPVKDQGAVVHG